MVADGSEEFHQANLELAWPYNFLHDSSHGIIDADLLALEAKEVKFVPLHYFKLEKSLGILPTLKHTRCWWPYLWHPAALARPQSLQLPTPL
jgi:hypothetical protein